MVTPCFHVDAFSARPFRGNPAAVCLLDKARPAAWMQRVAAENNLSETAFVVPGKRGFGLRWFTPTVEVALCGHATLASAHVLWSEGIAPADRELPFHTKSGVLVAVHTGRRIELNFPGRPAKPARPALCSTLATALGRKIRTAFVAGDDLLVELASESAVRRLQPDFAALARIHARGIIATARAKASYDFVSRFFAPAVGVPEDPVTGSAHCALAPFWAARLGKNRLKGYQASPRGGEVEVELHDDRVLLRGKAVTIKRSELLV